MGLNFFIVSENQCHDNQRRGAILRPKEKREKNEHKKSSRTPIDTELGIFMQEHRWQSS
jgi:hypothetical protein